MTMRIRNVQAWWVRIPIEVAKQHRSDVDIALWDILGKSLGQPVWRLIGGRKLDRMQAYASGGWASADAIGEQLKSYIAKGGFKALKMRVGAMDGAPHISAARARAAR